MRKIIFALSLVLSLFIIVTFLLGLKTKKIYDTIDLTGKPIPNLDLNLLNGDTNFNTQDLKKNKFTLINFWASWCAPCRKEHEHLISLNDNKNLKILGVNFKDKKSKANQFIKELGNPYYLIVSDTDGKKSLSFGIYGIPETILVNKDLIIIKKYIGPINAQDVKTIQKMIREE